MKEDKMTLPMEKYKMLEDILFVMIMMWRICTPSEQKVVRAAFTTFMEKVVNKKKDQEL